MHTARKTNLRIKLRKLIFHFHMCKKSLTNQRWIVTLMEKTHLFSLDFILWWKSKRKLPPNRENWTIKIANSSPEMS
jgi:hypothetical protein